MCGMGTLGDEGELAGVLGPVPPHSEPLGASPCLPVFWGSSCLPSFSPGWEVLRGGLLSQNMGRLPESAAWQGRLVPSVEGSKGVLTTGTVRTLPCCGLCYPVFVYRGLLRKHPQAGRFQTTDLCVLTVPQAASPHSGCGQGHAPSPGSREQLSLPLPSSGGPKRSLACGRISSVSASGVTWPPALHASSPLLDNAH